MTWWRSDADADRAGGCDTGVRRINPRPGLMILGRKIITEHIPEDTGNERAEAAEITAGEEI
jgi:hypothetical protein